MIQTCPRKAFKRIKWNFIDIGHCLVLICDIFLQYFRYRIGLDVYEKNNTMRSVFSPGNIFVSGGKKNEGQVDAGNDAYEIEKKTI